VAAEIAHLIRERAAIGRPAVLGLIAGQTSIPLFEALIYLHREEGLCFKNVIAFHNSEYLGLDADHPQTARSHMHRHFFGHVNIPSSSIHFPPTSGHQREINQQVLRYEQEISRAGGIDYQVLGIGRNGHLALNDAHSPINSPTRCVQLDEITREAVAHQFGSYEAVPKRAVTIGCRTILSANRIATLAWGTRKARIVRKALTSTVTPALGASYLHTHPSAHFFLDRQAASLLVKRPVKAKRTCA
jgi:glucosamine-6-phosphate deaminase